jgi:hypothetical protein
VQLQTLSAALQGQQLPRYAISCECREHNTAVPSELGRPDMLQSDFASKIAAALSTAAAVSAFTYAPQFVSWSSCCWCESSSVLARCQCCSRDRDGAAATI